MKKKKLRQILYVDGYNVINSWEHLRDRKEESLEAARDELENILEEYMRYNKERIILVYDGHLIKGDQGEKKIVKGLEIVFTKENITADSYIEREVANMPYGYRIRVATSDLAEQSLIFQRGASRLSSRELAIEIENSKRTQKRISKKINMINNMKISGIDEAELDKLKDLDL